MLLQDGPAKLNSVSWSISRRVNLSTLKLRLRNYLDMLLRLTRPRISSIFSLSILRMSSFSFLAFQGVSPVSISKKITPSAQMSVFRLYSFLFRDSGAMQSGEPTLYLLDLAASASLIANPKSATFSSWPSVISILAGLRSRWTICFLAKLRQPVMIWCMKAQACGSVSPFLTALLRSESQSSVMMQVLFLVVKTSWRARMWGSDLSSLRMSISLSRRMRLISFLSMRRSMTLTATLSLVSSLRPLQTWLEQPFPITSFSPYEQFQIFFRVQALLIALSLSKLFQQYLTIPGIKIISLLFPLKNPNKNYLWGSANSYPLPCWLIASLGGGVRLVGPLACLVINWLVWGLEVAGDQLNSEDCCLGWGWAALMRSICMRHLTMRFCSSFSWSNWSKFFNLEISASMLSTRFISLGSLLRWLLDSLSLGSVSSTLVRLR